MHTPLRMCVACRQMKPKGDLIKIIKKDDGAEVDVMQKKFGRGAYVCKSEECIENAKKRRAFSRHFKAALPDEIYDKIREVAKGE